MHNKRDLLKSHNMQRLLTLIRENKIVLWAGSGMSLYAGYPSGHQLCEYMYSAAKSESDRAVLQKQTNVLMNVAEEFEQLYSRKELIKVVSDCFDKEPSVEPYVHQLCTHIPQIDTIITTNYDYLFERAYGERIGTLVGTRYHVLNGKPVTLYKIHGDSSDPDSVVLTRKDYATFYDRLDSIVWNKLMALLAEKSVLFVGYSFEDKNIEDIFEKILRQVDSHESEFFIAVPSLPEHKLRHFNTICKTTHLPIDCEDLIRIIEQEIAENIVFDAIDKKISLEQAQSVAYEHGLGLSWKSVPKGRSIEHSIDNYVVNPFELLKFDGLTIQSDSDTYDALQHFLDDCDCRELVLPSKNVKLFENVNGINIPKSTSIDGKEAKVVKIEKPEQIDIAVLMVDNNIVARDVVISSFWGEKRKRLTIVLSSLDISILYENQNINITLSFHKRHTCESAYDNLKILSAWHDGKALVFSKRIGQGLKTILEMPPVDEPAILKEIEEFIERNTAIYQDIKRIEKYTNKHFLIPGKLSALDLDAITKVLSVFEPQNIVEHGDLDLRIKCDADMYKLFKTPAESKLDIVESVEEALSLFGETFTIKERKISIINPVIENIDEVKNKLLVGDEAIAKIVSSSRQLIMSCTM